MRRPRYSTVPVALSFSPRTARQIRLYESPALSSSSSSHVAYVIPTPFLLAAAATTFSFTLATVPPVRRAVNRLIRRTLLIQRRVGRLVQRQLSRRQWPAMSLLHNINNNKRRFSTQGNDMSINSGNGMPFSASQQQQPSLQETLQSELFLSTSSSRRSMPSSALKDLDSHLDRVRDRAVAQLRNEQLAVSASSSAEPISDVDYAALPPLQRRELLASTFHHRDAAIARKAEVVSPLQREERQRRSEQQQRVRSRAVKTVQASSKQNFEKAPQSPWWRDAKKKGGDDLATNLAFWQVVESVNGRAAAVGFMLCLAREIAEPGHPSLFEQVIDVVVPLAQSTPPFLVAVCDKLADLLT